jgi:hypothetical protein
MDPGAKQAELAERAKLGTATLGDLCVSGLL